MVSIPTGAVLVSCGFVLFLGLSVSSSTAEMNAEQSEHSQGGQASHEMGETVPEAGRTIMGEVLRIEGDNFTVKEQDGKEVQLRIDENTKMSVREIEEGTPITAIVNDQNHALSILSSDRRSDHTFESEAER